jgi:hypothetical protein
MEQVTTIPLSQQDVSTNPSLSLEQARETMVGLLSEAESNAWEIGDLLNTIENLGLARRSGSGRAKQGRGSAEQSSFAHQVLTDVNRPSLFAD